MLGQVKTVMGEEAFEITVTDSSTGSFILKLGGLMASVIAIEGGTTSDIFEVRLWTVLIGEAMCVVCQTGSA